MKKYVLLKFANSKNDISVYGYKMFFKVNNSYKRFEIFCKYRLYLYRYNLCFYKYKLYL